MLEYRVRGGPGAAVTDEIETAAMWTALLLDEEGPLDLSVAQYDGSLLDSQHTVPASVGLVGQARDLVQAARAFWQSLRPGP